MIKSKVNPLLTLEYMVEEPENKYFDRKEAKIKPSDIASLIVAFANAEGGTIAVGISDKKKTVEGFQEVGTEKINAFINVPRDCCKPTPEYTEEILNVINSKGKPDRILLLHIAPSVDQIIRTSNDSTYLRIGDKTKEIKGAELRNLEYNKSTRHYEDECHMDAKLEDMNEGLLLEYQKLLGAENMTFEQVLRARGFLKTVGEKEYLTNAAVLLFATNIQQFYPNCRIRFIRYDGNQALVGTRMNIIKDISIEDSILKIIEQAKTVISSQLREFTALNKETGKFKTVPEYPEFAWQEGIVNAVTHREYGMAGSYIQVFMYDDRLEIISPGKLPNIVTLENIKETRYSRNPRISRVLTEFGWVRELNEGVKRIYRDMEDFFLEPPIYLEPEQSVRLILKNNIIMRTVRQLNRVKDSIENDVWNQLDELDKIILTYMGSVKEVTRIKLEDITGKSGRTITSRLNKLLERNIIKRNGNKNDPTQTYELL